MTTFPFGKFKGSSIRTVPDSYLQWLLTLPNLDSPLRQAMQAEVNRRAVNRHVPAPVTARTTPLDAARRLTSRGWIASTAGFWSRWFGATTTRPGWAVYQASPALAASIQDYLDASRRKAKARNRRAA